MDFKQIEINNEKLVVVTNKQLKIRNAQDALELLVNCLYNLDINKIILFEDNLTPDFFDLKTGIAGEVLQKFSNYDGYLAIIGDYSKFTSKSLNDFIYESNRQKRINFVSSQEEALKALTT